MNNVSAEIYETQSAAAFNSQSSKFDELYSGNIIIQYKRKRVRDHVGEYVLPQSNILELNAGTGEDAIYFATHGHHVHATDIAPGMLQILQNKVNRQNLANNISVELCSYTQLENLQNKKLYDFIFSNFAGLNCTADLNKVLQSFSFLLKPGGFVTLVILPRFCLWETLLAFAGNFKTAFRRFKNKKGASAQIDGINFTCWYYQPSFIMRRLKNEFDLLSIEGLCSIVPPSYFEKFPVKHKFFFKLLVKLENKFKKTWPWKYIGDYYIISLRKK